MIILQYVHLTIKLVVDWRGFPDLARNPHHDSWLSQDILSWYFCLSCTLAKRNFPALVLNQKWRRWALLTCLDTRFFLEYRVSLGSSDLSWNKQVSKEICRDVTGLRVQVIPRYYKLSVLVNYVVFIIYEVSALVDSAAEGIYQPLPLRIGRWAFHQDEIAFDVGLKVSHDIS